MKKYGKVILILIFILLIFIFFKSDIGNYIGDREKITQLIDSMGKYGPLVYILIYILVTLTGVSALPLTIVGGLVFGAFFGIIYTAIGAGIGLSLAFLIARYIARDYIKDKFSGKEVYIKIDEGVKKQGWFILAVTRLIPIFPFGIQNYIYGLTSMGFFKYSILSTIFILPGTSVYVLLAGAIASGDLKKGIKMSILASLIFFVLTVITKLIYKKNEGEK